MCSRVNKCCFCISLETGTKIISILSLTCALATLAVYAGAGMSLPGATQAKQCFYMLVAVIALCHMFVCVLLVYGAFWNKPSFLWIWLVTSWMLCGGLMLLSLLGVILLTVQYYEDLETFTDISTMSTFYFVYAAIIYYFVTVVQSRRVQMIRSEETESADRLIRLRRQQDIPKSLLV